MQGEELQGDWEGAGGDGLEEECEQKGLSGAVLASVCHFREMDGKWERRHWQRGRQDQGIGTVIQRLSRADLVRQEVLKVGNE